VEGGGGGRGEAGPATATPPTHPQPSSLPPQLSLMDDSGNTKDDLPLPKGTDDAEKLAEQIQKDFEDGKELVVSVLKAMGEEMACAVKTVGGAS